jgi:hypothetical protein
MKENTNEIETASENEREQVAIDFEKFVTSTVEKVGYAGATGALEGVIYTLIREIPGVAEYIQARLEHK